MTTSLLALGTSEVLTIINNMLLIFGGIATFIIGMNIMGNNLEKAAGRPMRRLMAKATQNSFVGVGTGAAVTAIVTSSSATTVMIIGFVNVGIMTLTQAASVIMGANIGTTVSAFIAALSTAGSELEITSLFAFVTFIGVMMHMLCHKEKNKLLGSILQGCGLIFIGLSVMSSAVGSMMDDDGISGAIQSVFAAIGSGKSSLSWEIPVLFLLGAVLTGILQSSSALTAIIITLATPAAGAAVGLIDLPVAMFITMGANVGTCVTAMFSSLGASVNARRAAIVHLLFNIIGCAIFILPVAFTSGYIADALNKIMPGLVSWQIAIFHMLFNLLTTAILLPFQKYLVKLACLIVKDKKGPALPQDQETLDTRLLKTPAIAVGQARKEILRMGEDAFANYKLSLEMLLNRDMSSKTVFAEREKSINERNRTINSFLVKLSLEEISEIDENKVSSFYHVTSDLERIGDYAENITEYAEKMAESGASFSEHAIAEIKEMDGHITALYGYVRQTLEHISLSYIENVEMEEQATDDMCSLMQQSHLRRMNEGRCTPEAGAIYLQLALNMERIADHMHNIAFSIKSYADPIR